MNGLPEQASAHDTYSLDNKVTSFAEIYSSHYKGMVSVAIKQIQCNIQDAKDVAQTVFLDMLCQKSRFQGKSNVSTYLHSATANTAKDYLKTEIIKQRKVRDKLDGVVKISSKHMQSNYCPEIGGPAYSPEMGAFLREVLEITQKVLAENDQRSRIFFLHLQGEESQDIAKIVGCPRGTVMSGIYYITEKIKKVVNYTDDCVTRDLLASPTINLYMAKKKKSDGKPPSRDELESYSFMAIELRKEGWKVKEISKFFGLHQGSVSRWFTKHKRGGDDALRRRKAPGARPKFR